MVLVFKDNSKRTVSYPKWIIENHIGRRLKSNETVDHYDRDYTNDNINNLRVKLKSVHTSEDAIRVKPIEITCIWCGTKALKRATDLDGNAKQGRAGPFCSNKCSGIYGAELQNGRVKPFGKARGKTKREYYQLDKI